MNRWNVHYRHIYIHLLKIFIEYFEVPRTVLDTGDITVNKIDTCPALLLLRFFVIICHR